MGVGAVRRVGHAADCMAVVEGELDLAVRQLVDVVRVAVLQAADRNPVEDEVEHGVAVLERVVRNEDVLLRGVVDDVSAAVGMRGERAVALRVERHVDETGDERRGGRSRMLRRQRDDGRGAVDDGLAVHEAGRHRRELHVRPVGVEDQAGRGERRVVERRRSGERGRQLDRRRVDDANEEDLPRRVRVVAGRGAGRVAGLPAREDRD